jgi:hypothetical protein
VQLSASQLGNISGCAGHLFTTRVCRESIRGAQRTFTRAFDIGRAQNPFYASKFHLCQKLSNKNAHTALLSQLLYIHICCFRPPIILFLPKFLSVLPKDRHNHAHFAILALAFHSLHRLFRNKMDSHMASLLSVATGPRLLITSLAFNTTELA